MPAPRARASRRRLRLVPGWVRPHRRLGLRARVTAAFALSALLLSVLLALITYALTRSSVLHSEDTAARRQTFVNASYLRGGLRSSKSDVTQLLSSLGTTAGSSSVLYYKGQWYASSLALGRDALPTSLRSHVLSTGAGEQRFVLSGQPYLAIGVPVAAVHADYFEVFDLHNLDHTLSDLALSLAAAAAVTTVLGAVAGRWASRRTLAPLAETARVAAEISAGRLSTRLEADRDADLAGLASSFNSMVDALQGRIQRDARFASNVAHELRSPLTTLSTTLGVLVGRRDELSSRGQQALDLLGAEVRQFERLVQDLLEISRYDAGVVDQVLEPVRLDELVGHAMAVERAEGVPLVVEAGGPGLLVSGDKRRLERVVANLIGNARSHGGGAVEIRVQRAGDRVRLVVDDAGPGVPTGDRNRVFERFSRGPVARRRLGGDGVGLGLALVSEHVALHQGSVWVEDRPGGGARFVVELPALAARGLPEAARVDGGNDGSGRPGEELAGDRSEGTLA